MIKIEHYECFVERIDGDIAYINIKNPENGETFECEYSAKELEKYGIGEKKRFKHIFYSEFILMPDKEIDEEKVQKKIDEMMKWCDNDDPQNDY